MPRATFHTKQTFNKQLIPPLLVGTVFLAGITYFLHPFTLESTNAITETTQNGDYYLETTSTDLNLTIETTPAGNQVSSSHDVTAKTDDPAGYTLTVSVNNDTSNALNLNGNTSATEKFAATSGTYDSPKVLDENSWGFADTLAKSTNSQWAAVPLLSNAQQLKSTSTANTSGDTTTVYYAINAKYDGQHSNGNYSNTIVYSVTGNTIPTNTLKQAAAKAGITTMQTMTRDVCTSADIYQEGDEDLTLTDSRDSSTYQIRKLADGNCWMTQNLRIINKTLTTSDSNVSGNFTIPASSTSTGTTAGKWGTSNNANGIDHAAAYYNNDTTYGAYYNWHTATAGSGTYSTGSGVSVDYSICPKSGSGNTKATSWHLPTGMNTGEWYKMMITGYDYKDQSASSPNVKDWTTTAANLPFSGRVANGSLDLTTSYGNFWSSTAYDSTRGYDTDVDSDSYLNAGTYYYYKRVGFSVRCILTASS